MSGAGGTGLVAGVAADWVVGDPGRWHPVAGFGSVAAVVERRCWRPSRLAGVAYATVLVGGAAGVVAAADRRLAGRPVARMLLTGLVTWSALGGRSLAEAGRRLAGAVRGGDLEAARGLAPTLVGRDPSELDGPELCRAALESVAENTADALVGPLLWWALAGLACVLAPLVGGSAGRAWRTLRRDGGAHPSPNAGRMEAAFAGALAVRLGGVNRYGDRVERRPTLGDGAAPGPDDVDRAVRLSVLVGSAAAAVLVLVGRR